MSAKKQKVAVLGGGCGAMAAAWALTSAPGWQEHYEVTVYQMGWRLGGKGAAGRNMEQGARIEEHGFHIWFGFYENAFRMIREVYEELDRSPGEALATWEEAFIPHHHVVLQEQLDGEWVEWSLPFPANDELPGSGKSQHLFTLFRRTLQLLQLAFSTHQSFSQPLQPESLKMPRGLQEQMKRLGALSDAMGSKASLTLVRLVQMALHWVESLLSPTLQGIAGKSLSWLLKQIKAQAYQMLAPRLPHDTSLRRLWVLLDISTSCLVGMVADGVLTKGFEAIDEMDFTDWLLKHGLTSYSQDAAPLRSAYNLTFGYPCGDIERPRFAAGSGLYGLLLMTVGYKGAVMWKMVAGMGDTIFTPLYQVLARRGVTFKFFHKVQELQVDPDQDLVSQIVVAEQAALKEEGGSYDPFVRVKGLDTWPNQPKWEQLEAGEELKQKGVNFESAWCHEPPHKVHTLRRGEDFHLVVLGTSVAPLRTIAAPLCKRHEPFRRMVQELKTVETIGVQLWLRPTLQNLGWRKPSPVMGAFVEPIDTFADLTELLPYEDWSGPEQPQQLTYLCGPLPCPPEAPLDDPDYPQRKRELVKAMTRNYLEQDVATLWPEAGDPLTKRGFCMEHLTAHPDATPQERFDSQYFRANVDPCERYVLTLPGTNQYRLHPGQSGFANLFLAGDWTWTPFNSGCVEAAVISGLLASQAISGWPKDIISDEILARPTKERK